jgi:hypothetical protein
LELTGRARDFDGLAKLPDFQLQVDDGRFSGGNRERLLQGLKALRRYGHSINSFRDVIQSKLAVCVGLYGLTSNDYFGSRNRPVLWIVNYPLQNARGSAHGQTRHY